MSVTYLLTATASILALSAAAGPAQTLAGPAAPSAAVSAIEDATKIPPVGPGASGPMVTRAQILLDRARFSPGQIDGVYGDDLGVAVKGYQENHALKPTGMVDARMWRRRT